jgi:WD40 repeat protein
MTPLHDIPPGDHENVRALAFTPDARLAIAVSQRSPQSSFVRVLDVETASEVGAFVTNLTRIDSAAISADGRRIVAATLDGSLELWDLRPPRSLALFRGTKQIVATSFGKRAAITADGRLAATGSGVGVLRIWNEDDPEHHHHALQGHLGSTTAIALTKRGTRLAAADTNHTVSVWSTETGEKLATARLDGLPLTMDAENHQFLVGDLDGDVLCFDYVEPEHADAW